MDYDSLNPVMDETHWKHLSGTFGWQPIDADPSLTPGQPLPNRILIIQKKSNTHHLRHFHNINFYEPRIRVIVITPTNNNIYIIREFSYFKRLKWKI